jgi:dTDP-4-dehydrorhamnose reductase
MIGRSLATHLQTQGIEPKSSIESTGVSQIDLATIPDKSSDWIRDFQTVYFFAGITSHEKFVKEPEYACWINTEQTIKWLRFLEDSERVIVFPSTSLVYGGTVDLAKESFPTSPQGLYAQSKLEVEDYLLDSSTRAKVVRLTKVVSAQQPLFQKWIRNLSLNLSIAGYVNSTIAPVHVRDVISVLPKVAAHQNKGIWNISSNESASLYDYALQMAIFLGYQSELVSKSTCDETLTVRQKYALLNCEKASKDFNFTPPSLLDSIEGFKTEISL